MNILSIINFCILTVDLILIIRVMNKNKELIKLDKEMVDTYNEYLRWRREDYKFYEENLEVGKKIDEAIEEGKIKFIQLDFHTGRNKIIK